MGSSGSKRIWRCQRVCGTGAIAIGVAGCPEFACCTASMARVRMVFTQSASSEFGMRSPCGNLVVDSNIVADFQKARCGMSSADQPLDSACSVRHQGPSDEKMIQLLIDPRRRNIGSFEVGRVLPFARL